MPPFLLLSSDFIHRDFRETFSGLNKFQRILVQIGFFTAGVDIIFADIVVIIDQLRHPAETGIRIDDDIVFQKDPQYCR